MPSQGKLSSAGAKRTRGRTGCLNCRRRRKKCDEKKPSCSKCNVRGEKCEWDTGVTFRCSGLDAGHPSMRQAATMKPSTRNEFHIINTPYNGANVSGSSQSPDDTTSARRISVPMDQRPQVFDTGNRLALGSDHIPTSSGLHHRRASQLSHDLNGISAAGSLLHNDFGMVDSIGHSSPEVGAYANQENLIGRSVPSLTHQSTSSTAMTAGLIDPTLEPVPPASKVALFRTRGAPFPEIDSQDLASLDYLMSKAPNFDLFPPENDAWNTDQSVGAVPLEPIMVESPDMYATYYPDPTYKELHSVLHNHMVETARNTALTRQGTPEPNPHHSSTLSNALTQESFLERRSLEGFATMIKPVDKVSRRKELELWQNYLEEVAVWLDMFDIERHFQLIIPIMAKKADHLHYSILALSARQLERMHADKPYTDSLTLYQKAIELIVRDLPTMETSVIASCVLLCVLEMMSSSPKAWGRHLDGCSMLLQAAGINGTVGGVRQALFWCFARMDVWGGFLSESRTKIPTNRWFMPSGSMSSAVMQFKNCTMGFDSYANYAVFLCASAINVLSRRGTDSRGESSELDSSYSARWKALFDLLEDWYRSRPEEMQPLMGCPTSLEDHQHPFPILLYGTSPAINGNQLYHASSLLMLQDKPRDIRLPKSHKSIVWHARQICGIATSNRIHGPWINALQPLWIAGKVMSHPIEHRVILETLARIEKETGWATTWRAEDLKEYWGETDDD